MNNSIYRISLDIHGTSSQTSISVKRGDTARSIYITLAENGKPYKIAEGCYAVLSGKKADGNYLYNDCTIKDNVIIYNFTEQTVPVIGKVDCEITLYDADGDSITSPSFTLMVEERVYNGEDIISSDEANALISATAAAKAITIEVETKLANGEFVGAKGDKGDKGEQGETGKKTVEGGEIFNDYKNNKASAPFAHVEGVNNTGGIKGYRIINSTDLADNCVLLTVDNTDVDVSVTQAYSADRANGSVLNFSGVLHYSNSLKIIAFMYDPENNIIDNQIIVTPVDENMHCSATDNTAEIYLGLDSDVESGLENWCWVSDVDHGEVILAHRGIHVTGDSNIAQGRGAFVSGRDNKAIGDYANASGRRNIAYDYGSVRGNDNIASHLNSDVSGYYNRSSAKNQLTTGVYNAPAPDALLVVGNGTAWNDRRNALEVNKDGTVTIQSSPKKALDVANKGYVDGLANTLFTHTNNLTINSATDSVLHKLVFNTEEDLLDWVKLQPTIPNDLIEDTAIAGVWEDKSMHQQYYEPISTVIDYDDPNGSDAIMGAMFRTGTKVTGLLTWQTVYHTLNLKPNTHYRLSFNMKSNGRINSISIIETKGAEYGSNMGNVTNATFLYSKYLANKDVSQGEDFIIDFTTKDESECNLCFSFGDKVDNSAGYAYIDFICIWETYVREDGIVASDIPEGTLLLVKDSKSPDYWWTGADAKPIGRG